MVEEVEKSMVLVKMSVIVVAVVLSRYVMVVVWVLIDGLVWLKPIVVVVDEL